VEEEEEEEDEDEEEEEDEEEDEEEEEDACFVLCMTGIVRRFVFVEGQFHCSWSHRR